MRPLPRPQGPATIRSAPAALALALLVTPVAGAQASSDGAGPAAAGRRSALEGVAGPAGPGHEELVSRLRDGRVLRARIGGRDAGEATGARAATWHGRLAGGPGRAALAVVDGVLAGVVREGGRVWRLSAGVGTALEVERVDPTAFAPCEVEAAPGGAPAAPGPGPLRRARPTGIPRATVVDVLVAWTQEAEDAAGGPAAVQALAALAVLETNLAYEASLVPLELRLVFSSRVDYVESGSQATDLARLRDPDDGHMDEVHAWRDVHGADAVSLLVADQSACGRSYNVFSFGGESHTFAFSLVSQACAVANLSFAHELGHNFGLDHDRAHTQNAPSWPFAHGYVTPDDEWRTIMALATEGVPSVRVPFYSTPWASFGGWPLGLPPADPHGSDCARALALNAPSIAAWRPTAVAVESGRPRRARPTSRLR